MRSNRLVWIDGVPYYEGGVVTPKKVLIGEHGAECIVPAHIDVNKIPKDMLYKGDPNMQRIKVRDNWEPSKVLGTLPWDGKETERRFSWQHSVNGHPTQEIIKLQVHRMIAGDYDEMAYSSGLHKIEVLRKLPDFCEATDER